MLFPLFVWLFDLMLHVCSCFFLLNQLLFGTFEATSETFMYIGSTFVQIERKYPAPGMFYVDKLLVCLMLMVIMMLY